MSGTVTRVEKICTLIIQNQNFTIERIFYILMSMASRPFFPEPLKFGTKSWVLWGPKIIVRPLILLWMASKLHNWPSKAVRNCVLVTLHFDTSKLNLSVLLLSSSGNNGFWTVIFLFTIAAGPIEPCVSMGALFWHLGSQKFFHASC